MDAFKRCKCAEIVDQHRPTALKNDQQHLTAGTRGNLSNLFREDLKAIISFPQESNADKKTR